MGILIHQKKQIMISYVQTNINSHILFFTLKLCLFCAEYNPVWLLKLSNLKAEQKL